MIIVRSAKAEDYDEIIVLFGKFAKDPKRYQQDNDSFDKVLADKNSFADVVEVENKIVGFISYSIRNVIRYPKPICEVEEFFVLEECRRSKLGEKLMESVIKFAKKNNCQYIFLASGKELTAGHEFYKYMKFDEYAFHYRREP